MVSLKPCFSVSAVFDLRKASRSVMSASSNCVTCGIITQLRCRFAAESFLMRERALSSTGPNLAKSTLGHSSSVNGNAPPVAAPAPLDGTAIVYRLGYVDPARAEVYADSRWAERMSVLLTQRVKSRMAGIAAGVVSPADGARADYVLRMELEDFSQHFDSAAASRAVVRVRAALVDAGSRSLRAQRTFSAERPAGVNAASGVKALAEAADAVIAELTAWTAQNVTAAGGR